MPKRLLAAAIVLLATACGPAAAGPGAPPPTCNNADEHTYLIRVHTCVASKLVPLQMAGPAPAATPLALPAAQPPPAGSKLITYPAAGDITADTSGSLTVGDGAVWFTGDGLWRVDAADRVSRVAGAPAEVADVAFAAGSLWFDTEEDTLTRLDPAGHPLASIGFPENSLLLGEYPEFGSIWVAEHHHGAIGRVDPTTNKLVATVQVAFEGSDGPKAITAIDGSLWVAIPNINSVLRIDPARGEIVADIPFPKSESTPCGLTATPTTLWETSCDNNLLTRIDPRRNRVTATYDLGATPGDAVAAGEGTIWIGTGGDADHLDVPGYLLHIADDGTVLQRYALGTGFVPVSVVIAFGSLWVADLARPRLLRIPLPG
jgi:streptogramin lyase